MSTWAEFEHAAPELARVGRERIERHGFMLLGTVRRDGTARISPVELRIVEGLLTMSLLPGSTKERDLLRDARLLLHSPVLHAHDPNDELKLRGRASRILDDRLARAAAGWTPPPDLAVYAVELDDAAFIEWSQGEKRITRWRRE